MGFWSKVKKAVKKAAKKTKEFVNDVGDTVSNVVEGIGNGINDGLNWLGDKIGAKSAFSWLGGVIKGVFSIVASVVKLVFSVAGAILGGIIGIVGGILTLQGSLIVDSFVGIFTSILGGLIVLGGKIIAWVQSIFYLQGFERPLTDDEKRELKRLFKNTLSYYVIRIVDGHSGIYGLNDRPFVLGNTVYMKSKTFPFEKLVHEIVHVWQYQQYGSGYSAEAIGAQWFVDDEYNWEKEIIDRNKQDWEEFNREAQGKFFEHLWVFGELHDNRGNKLQGGNGVFLNADGSKTFGHFPYNGSVYTDIANRAVKTVQNEWF